MQARFKTRLLATAAMIVLSAGAARADFALTMASLDKGLRRAEDRLGQLRRFPELLSEVNKRGIRCEVTAPLAAS